MCLAVPLQIIAIDQDLATVTMSGVQRQISLALTPEAQVGDYVLVHTGYAISLISPEEAQETLQLFADIAAAVEQADADKEAS
ncbi:MAG: HypC/HybG/HupF family hydrogenase formation chaperone [Chloroflexi bacterium]|nr:HypC/HybG/HupF family hydrogenase formation chaperone [Chloroflexota bacterium]